MNANIAALEQADVLSLPERRRHNAATRGPGTQGAGLCETYTIYLRDTPERCGAVFSAAFIHAGEGNDWILALLTGGRKIVYHHSEFAQMAFAEGKRVGLPDPQQWFWHEQLETLANEWVVSRVQEKKFRDGTRRYVGEYLFNASRASFANAPEGWSEETALAWWASPVERVLRELARSARDAWMRMANAREAQAQG